LQIVVKTNAVGAADAAERGEKQEQWQNELGSLGIATPPFRDKTAKGWATRRS
jgi:hypothetical protein